MAIASARNSLWRLTIATRNASRIRMGKVAEDATLPVTMYDNAIKANHFRMFRKRRSHLIPFGKFNFKELTETAR